MGGQLKNKDGRYSDRSTMPTDGLDAKFPTKIRRRSTFCMDEIIKVVQIKSSTANKVLTIRWVRT